MDAQGNLYGICTRGGSQGLGTVWKVAHGTSAITVVENFTGPPSQTLCIDSSGNVFGAFVPPGSSSSTILELRSGSASMIPAVSLVNDGTIVQLACNKSGDVLATTVEGAIKEWFPGSTFVTAVGLLPFTAQGQSPSPTGVLAVDAAGNLFGTTRYGGANGDGYIFELAGGYYIPSVIASFSSYVSPNGVILDGNGNLYGTGLGTVFELARGSGGITTVASMTGQLASPNGLAVDSSGNLYGSASGGLFEIPKGASTATQLANLPTGASQPTGILRDTAGNLYTPTTYGGSGGNGEILELPAGGANYASIASFDTMVGISPGNLVSDSSGDLFGEARGDFLAGHAATVFEIPSGSSSPQLIAGFQSTFAGNPVLDGSGNLYGMTGSRNGTSTSGSIFEIPHGTSTAITLASLGATSSNGYPVGLTSDSAGNLYGVTSDGGTNGNGFIFELPHGAASVSTLASLTSQTAATSAELVLDSSGNLFGGSRGSVWELVHGASTVTMVSSDFGSAGVHSLTFDGYGNLFGTLDASSSGVSGPDGAVFELPNGSSTPIIFQFDGANGALPAGTLAVDQAGNVFGATSSGGPSNNGAVFEIIHGSSTITPLAYFNTTDGADPNTGLTIDSTGNLYGGSPFYPGANNGLVFKVAPLNFADQVSMANPATSLTLLRDADGQDVDWQVGSSAGYLPIADALGLTATASTGNVSLQLDTSNGNPLPNTVHLNGTFIVNGLTGSNPLAGTTLDLSKQSAVYLAYSFAASDPFGSIKTDLEAGYNGATWTGTPSTATGAITSSAAAANPAQLAVGYADSADPNSPDTVSNTIELKTTLVGDTNLDGSVNLSDLLTLTRNFGKGSNWDQGDFNYDSSVNLSDFLALSRNFGKTIAVNPLVVTSTADDGSLGTLRYAISHSNPGDTITFDPAVFAPGTTHALTLKGSQLEITHNLTIQGPGSANLSISGNNTSRIFQIDPSVTASILGLTLTAANAGTAYGGAINNSGTLNLTNCSITSSTAKDGGGLYSISGSANVTNCTFSSDTASAYGGALFNDAQATSTVTGCTFTNNSAGHGGALLDYGTALVLINDTITQNTSTGSGGGINNVAGNLIVSNCTILNNTTGSAGGGIYNGQTATINNSIVAENTTTSASPTDLAGNSFAGSNNLIGDGSGGLSASNHNVLGSTSNLLNPKLGSLSSNGGPTLTFMPLSGSPVIDAGSNALIPTGISTDQRGYARIFNGTVDIGAVEFGASLVPTLTSATQQQSASTTARRRV